MELQESTGKQKGPSQGPHYLMHSHLRCENSSVLFFYLFKLKSITFHLLSKDGRQVSLVDKDQFPSLSLQFIQA
jgi:hypothetical protein